MNPAEVLGVEVAMYRSEPGGVVAYVPNVVGATTRAIDKKATASRMLEVDFDLAVGALQAQDFEVFKKLRGHLKKWSGTLYLGLTGCAGHYPYNEDFISLWQFYFPADNQGTATVQFRFDHIMGSKSVPSERLAELVRVIYTARGASDDEISGAIANPSGRPKVDAEKLATGDLIDMLLIALDGILSVAGDG